MTSIFIVRPFGTKSFPSKDAQGNVSSIDVDFEEVQRLLIDKAVAKCGLTCSTTGPIAKAGNIRLDMFQMLIAHDLVIADISIDNANAFYELGIRHGLRPKGTILIRFATGRDVPFDLKTDRYLEYDRTAPGAAVDQLARAIEQTLAVTRAVDGKPDSPVFLLLPELDAPDPAKLMVVPRDFQEAVERAAARLPDVAAPTLALLAKEAEGNDWAREGVRLVARIQVRRRDWKAARESWEFIRQNVPADVEANLQLSTVYQRLGDLVAAAQACRHVLEDELAKREARADARAQLARNEKSLWVAAFSGLADEEQRRSEGLDNPLLLEAFKGYRQGFAEDLNSYYAGINALGLATVIVRLAELVPATWSGKFASDEEAAAALLSYRKQLERLAAAVRLSIDNALVLEAANPQWVLTTDAQYALLTSTRPAFVANAYRQAKARIGDAFPVESEAAQVAIFQALGLFPENCAAAFQVLGRPAAAAPGASAVGAAPRDRVIVATGHRADAAGRATPRFPNTPECIEKARTWLRETLATEKARTAGSVWGIGGGASGADLLFHQVCAELGIPTRLVLAIPEQEYRRASVADGGPDWVEMFNDLVAANPPIVLGDSDKLPNWASSIPDYSVFQRGNIWMMEAALLRANADTTLVALWNGQAGDGPGGTADMVKLAKAHGARTLVKDSKVLFGLG